jgi:hypothetical protein
LLSSVLLPGMGTTVPVESAKHALLARLIDDASLFPPAGFAMRRALRAHARHRESAYAWVGGRFVVPASRLDECRAELVEARPALELSVILDAATSGAKGDAVLADLERIGRAGLADATVASLELGLPVGGLEPESLRRALGQIAARWPGATTLWCEPAYRQGWTVPVETTLAALAELRAEAPAVVQLGAKVRCSAIAPDDLAAFVVAAHAHALPWKATAGLHQPVRGLHGAAHGFLNLFVAGIALDAGVLAPTRVAEVLVEDDPRAFVVDPTHLAWRTVRVETAAVGAARAQCTSFGSCSFEEPVNALRELGILA